MRLLKETDVWQSLHFVWIGDESLYPDFTAHITQRLRDMGITDKVTRLGHVDNVTEWLDAADIFILTSELEGMPLSVMEAMAKGLPVIATAVSGIPEELAETGKIVADPKVNPTQTVTELAATLQVWADNPQNLVVVGEQCKQRAIECFREARMIDDSLPIICRSLLPQGDYVSPGFQIIQPDDHFPNMMVGNPYDSTWAYLRRQVPHNWYVDAREPTVGFLNRDEAHILYNTALKFKGKRVLEIGCWLGWSACHLALAGVELDVIDPLLDSSEFYASVRNSLQSAGVLDRVNLKAGYSPHAVKELAEQYGCKWSLIFIDGNHEAPHPLQDAVSCESYAEADAIVLFHDLASPDVAEGLGYFRQRGWQTMIYQTMQIMGVAWRGNVSPVTHQPDPTVNWQLPQHLQDYCVSGVINQEDVHDSDSGSLIEKPPIILIDGVFFQRYKTGIARVWRTLLSEWAGTTFANHIVVLDRAKTAPQIPGIRYHLIPAHDYNHLEDDRALLQELCDEEGADLFISTYYSYPLSTPSVLMVHDMIPEVAATHDPRARDTLDEPMWQEKHAAISRASAFIAVSENTAYDLVTFFPDIDPTQVTIAKEGVAAVFQPASPPDIATFKQKYGIHKPYFLTVGSSVGYKNTILFYQAIAQLVSHEGFDIVAVGAGGALEDEFRAYTKGITVHTLRLSDEELAIAYSGAIALVYPSKYEGFGLPIVEAMACGCPVVTCANGSIPEVAGDAALYVSDTNVMEMVDALCEVQKPHVRGSLIAAGLERARSYSWTDMATAVAAALVDATLLPLRLQAQNYIIFPDWAQGDDAIAEPLATLLQQCAASHGETPTTLLIDTHAIAPELADQVVSGVIMALALEAGIDVTETLCISLVPHLGEIQWRALAPKLTARLVFSPENIAAVEAAQLQQLQVLEDIWKY